MQHHGPKGLLLDQDGSLIFADGIYSASTSEVWRVTASGAKLVTTFAGEILGFDRDADTGDYFVDLDEKLARMSPSGVLTTFGAAVNGLGLWHDAVTGTQGAIDGRETAPAKATSDMYVRGGKVIEGYRVGPLSAGVPGLVSMLHRLFKEKGSGNVTWRELVQPAIELAREGRRVDGYDEGPITRHMQGREIDIAVDVGVGRSRATVWTCDLTHGYIAINADYRT